MEHPNGAMRFKALATDYDGTLATQGRVDRETIIALTRLRSSGRLLILVTGRELPDLRRVFSRCDLFEWIVAENGAVLYCPASLEEKVLCEPPSPEFVEHLRRLRVPISVGRAIVATQEPYEKLVRALIRDLGLDLRIALNKGSLMVLPRGVDKQSGLRQALGELALDADDVVAIGDAENDHPFLAACGCAVAVANALPELKLRADLVTARGHGAGVAEIIDELLADDLASACSGRARPR
jgi:HAD superfamily hydrolase (TIGR01484 family)